MRSLRSLVPALPPLFFTTIAAGFLLAAGTSPTRWEPVDGWLKLPDGITELGNAHGDVAVSANGEVYLSLLGGLRAGVQVYSAEGRYLRNLPGAPTDFHGFVLHREAGGEFLYGPLLTGQKIVKLSLDGQVVLTIPGEAIPPQYWMVNPKTKAAQLKLTACDVAPNGDIYVTDGYASDYIHRFNAKGEYQSTFGGKAEPYKFNNLHKLAIDTRFDPARLLVTDRANGRVAHLSLDGELIGDVATGLRLPSAVVTHGDLLAIGELKGRVTLLDKENQVVAYLGTNEVAGEIGTNRTEPAKWRPGAFNAAHGVAFNADGDLFVTEWSLFGRVHRFDRAD